jgi:hypothetical protein
VAQHLLSQAGPLGLEVVWVNEVQETGLPYDILVREPPPAGMPGQEAGALWSDHGYVLHTWFVLLHVVLPSSWGMV